MKTMAVTGKPSKKLMDKIESEDAKNYVKSLPSLPKRELTEMFKGVEPIAIECMERMLDLDPDSRINAEEALAHPYFKNYADPTDEPSSDPYDAAFEKEDYEIDEWKKLVVGEINKFEPIVSLEVAME